MMEEPLLQQVQETYEPMDRDSIKSISEKKACSSTANLWRGTTAVLTTAIIIAFATGAINFKCGGDSGTQCFAGLRRMKIHHYYSAVDIVTGADETKIPSQLYLNSLPEFLVTEHGAIGDGETINTEAFQRALDAAREAGGGVVTVEAGNYKVGGAIHLWSNTFLNIERDAVVMASSHEEDFPFPEAWADEGNPKYPGGRLPAVIRSSGQSNIGIVGEGTIDGGAIPGYIDWFNTKKDQFQPRKFRQNMPNGTYSCKGECRPQLVLLDDCTNVRIEGIILQNSPDWTLHVRGCSNVWMSNLTIRGDWKWPNNDGVDIDSSSDVTLTNSTIITADDAICVKTTKGLGITHNLLITHNVAKSRSGAFKIGSSTQEDVRDVFVDHLYIMAGTNRGLGIQHRDAGNIDGVHFRNIEIAGTELQPKHWWGTAEPIFVTSNKRNEVWELGDVANITFENINAYGIAGTTFLSADPVGSGNSTVSKITFINTNILMSGPRPTYDNGEAVFPFWSKIDYEEASKDYRPTYMHPSLEPYDPNERIGFVVDSVENVQIKKSNIGFPKSATPAYKMICSELHDAQVRGNFHCHN